MIIEYEKIVAYGDISTRRFVAVSKNVPVKILKILSKDRCFWVRVDVAKNPNTPLEVVYKLACDENEMVRNAALKRL